MEFLIKIYFIYKKVLKYRKLFFQRQCKGTDRILNVKDFKVNLNI